MEQEKEQNTEPNKELSEGKKPVYFSMSMPNWFMNKEVDEKCDIVEDLAEQLKGSAKPISPQQRKQLFTIG